MPTHVEKAGQAVSQRRLLVVLAMNFPTTMSKHPVCNHQAPMAHQINSLTASVRRGEQHLCTCTCGGRFDAGFFFLPLTCCEQNDVISDVMGGRLDSY